MVVLIHIKMSKTTTHPSFKPDPCPSLVRTVKRTAPINQPKPSKVKRGDQIKSRRFLPFFSLFQFTVRGKWSSWSRWSDCNAANCRWGVKTRTRACDDPSPVNGGPGCQGEAVEKDRCLRVCPPQHGQWSSWESWSTCSTECRQFRQRTCSNPPPANGGRRCIGQDTDGQACQGSSCNGGSIILYGGEPVRNPDEGGETGFFGSDVTLIVGLIAALVVFAAVVIVLCKLLRRKHSSRSHSGYRLRPSGRK